MNRMKSSITAALVVLLASIGMSAQAKSPSQTNDQRMLQLVRRLETNADRFSNSLDAALDRSRLDGSMREDDVNALVDVFEYETDQLRERIEDREAVAADVEAVLIRALRLEMFMQRQGGRLGARARSDWMRVRSDLDALSRAFNVTWVWTIPVGTQASAPMRTIPVRQAIRRIESRTDEFQNTLDWSLDQSSLNGTALENELNALVQNLEKEADQLRDRADNRPGGGIAPADVESVLKRAMLVETFMMNHGGKLSSRARRDWARVKANLDELARAYNVAWVWTVTVTPAASSSR